MTPGLQPSTSKTNANLGRCPRLVSLRAFSPQLVRQREIIVTPFSLMAVDFSRLTGQTAQHTPLTWKSTYL